MNLRVLKSMFYLYIVGIAGTTFTIKVKFMNGKL